MPSKGRPPPPPKPEELIEILDKKFEEYKLEMAETMENKSNEMSKLREDQDVRNNQILARIEELQQSLDRFKEEQSSVIGEVNETQKSLCISLREELQSQISESLEEQRQIFEYKISKIDNAVASESSVNAGAHEQIQEIIERVDEINEKMYEFEVNKRNNLIFYGIQAEPRETPSMLLSKVNTMLRTNLNIKRDIVVNSASRVMTGPDVVGTRPVVVTFQEFKDREEVLRKSGVLKGNNIHITEDMSRRVREGRAELRKFLRDVKRQNPAANTVLQYDKLFVNHRCYVFSDIQGKVVEYSPGDIDPGIGRPGSVLARSSSVMSMAGGGQGPAPAVKRRAPASGMWRSQSCLSDLDQEPGISQDMLEERDAKIRELEETIKALQEKLGACDRSENNIINDKDEDILENDKQENIQTLNASGQENCSDNEHDDNPTQ